MKKIILLILSFWYSHQTWAQQEASFTHYMYNSSGINAAYVGSRDVLAATLLHRTQWMSLDGAPVTQTFNVHTPVGNQKIALGMSIINEKIGPTKSTAFYGDVAYRMMLSDNSRIAFGLKAGVNVFKTSFKELDIGEVYDEAFAQDLSSEIIPNFGTGVYYDTPNFYVGLSVPRMLNNKMEGQFVTKKRHYYLIAGYATQISERLMFKPTTVIKATAGAPVIMDLTGEFVVNDRFSLGAKYRTNDGIGILLGLNLSKVLIFGYSFDWSTGSYWNKTKNLAQRTSHELMLRYEFDYKDKVHSPRYF